MSENADRLKLRGFISDLRSEPTPLVVLLLVVVALFVSNYLVMPVAFYEAVPAGVRSLARFVWWTGIILVAWFFVPLAVAKKLGFGWRALGLSPGGLMGKLWMYLLLYLVSLGFIAFAATQPAFIETYPFLRADEVVVWSWRILIAYWAIYAVQFFCVEFLFRGFMIFTLRPRFGYAAIPVMTVAYAIFHFPKPAPEALAAIPGGLVLGWMAFKTNSIWGGVLLHVAIALTMDCIAMANNTTGFPILW